MYENCLSQFGADDLGIIRDGGGQTNDLKI